MKKLLLGIALILFGMFCLNMYGLTDGDFFAVIGMVTPFAGIALAVWGAVQTEK